VSPSTFVFTSEVWEHDGDAAWHFVSLPPDVADDIEAAFGHRAAGFGSIRVEVTVGATTWQTSLFPDNKRATYLLPVKKPVRAAEGLVAGSQPKVSIRVLV
jgi:hypothetical protein